MSVVYRVGDNGADVLDKEHRVVARLRPGALLYGDSIEAIAPGDAAPIQAKMRRERADKARRPGRDYEDKGAI